MLKFKIILIKIYNKIRIIIRIYLNKKRRRNNMNSNFILIDWI